MILSKVFERFEQGSPISVMVRGTLQNVFARESLDELFAATAKRQVASELLFSSVVDLLSVVVMGTRKSVHEAYQNASDKFGVSVTSVYNKLNGTEPAVCRELVRRPAKRLVRVVDQMKTECSSPLAGYLTLIVDGNHFPSTQHRIKELRTTSSGPLPGQALAVLDPQRRLIVDIIPCEDAHAQERSLLPELVERFGRGDAVVADRNFCTTAFLFSLNDRKASFVIRQHGSTLSWETVGRQQKRGRCKTGIVYEQQVCLTNAATGQEMKVRRVTLKLDKATRKGDEEIHILTNIPASRASSQTIAMAYRERWTIENAFQELAQSLRSEIDTLGYPGAALLGFAIAVLTYNAISTAKAALRAVHGTAAAPETISSYYLASELAATYHGMMIAIPESAWQREFDRVTVPSLARILKAMAANVRLRQFRKHTTGPKKPPPKRTSGKTIHHVSTARILAKRQRKAAK